jgi:3-oxoacyl-[acyl-carrier-protein] synthase II
VAEAWSACSSGKSGIGPITHFDASEFRTQIAGEVRNYQVPDIVSPKEARKMELFIRYAVGAAAEALQDYNACSVSACTSSNHAIGTAARIIERGDAKIMLAGGSESAVTPLGVGGFAAMRALSTRNDDPERASRPYDQDRDGFVLSEGGAMLILEDYEFAKARGARIYCEIIGYGVSSDAHHITAPSMEGPARAMKLALKDAKLNSEDLDYVNAHGTSTPAGDLNELRALKLALGEDIAKKISISSTKSMTGHLLGAAAAIEAVFSIKAMEQGLVPPTINVENLDPECDLDITPNVARERQITHVMSNAFGFGGTNASVIFRKI